MSYRIERAMGWGIDWSKFEEVCLFEGETQKTGDWLRAVFGSVDSLTVPREHFEELFYAKQAPRPPVIVERDLLATRFTNGGRDKPERGNPEKLFELVSTPNDNLAVIFFPNLYFRKTWHRWDNDLDYAFEHWRGSDQSRYNENAPRDFIKYLPYGHYPWANYLMLADGTPQEWLSFVELRKRPDLLPAVPSEIRWYLNELKVMDDKGVNLLRPVIAQWWS